MDNYDHEAFLAYMRAEREQAALATLSELSDEYFSIREAA